MSVHRSLILGFLFAAALSIAYTYKRPTATLETGVFRYIFVFDISQSMNVTDVSVDDEPVSRLELSKQAALNSLSALPCDSEIGVALFSGHRAFLLVTPIEVCGNYAELSKILNQLDWRMTWERSSEIAKGLYKSLNLLTLIETQTRLVFFTDGHESPPIRPEVPPKFTGTVGDVSGIVIGVGGDEAVEIPKFDEAGNRLGVWKKDEVVQGYASSKASPSYGVEHLSALREDYLKKIAEEVGLEYYRLLTPGGFGERIQAKNMAIARSIVRDIRWVFALLALALLVAVSLLRPRLATA